ncbi:urea transporter [Vibrio alfacsensis]|uniref:urea transporter n=1 Tax=Vibrio alfacsensis TaxID=1074311 RepID=UPI0040683E96
MNNFVTYCLRGTSQVFFMNNALTGVLFAFAIVYASFVSGQWSTAIGALLGVVMATAVAVWLKLDKEMIESGLYGFNGVLFGIALPTFIANSVALWVLILVGAAFSVVVTEAFKNTLTKKLGIPGSTGPFVLCGWLFMVAAYNFGHVDVSMYPKPVIPTDYVSGEMFFPSLSELVTIFFKNIGEVYLLGSAVSGAIILAGIFIASIPAGVAAVGGSIVAIVFAIILGANPNAVSAGLYGFSPVLTAMAIGVIFMPVSTRTTMFALFATIITVVLQASFDILMQPDGLPSFTFPYVFTLYVFMAAKNVMEVGTESKD